MRSTRRATIAAMLALLATHTAAAEPPVAPAAPASVRLVYADYRPYSWLEFDRPRGLEIEIAEALFRRLRLPVEHRILPWARAQADVAQGEADAFIATVTPERLQYADKVGPPLLQWQAAAFFRKENGAGGGPGDRAGALSIAELCAMKLAALRGNSWVKTHLHCAEPAPAPSTESLVRMLLARRIDAVIEDKLVLLDLARQLGVSTQLRTQPLEAGAAPMYLLIGKRSPPASACTAHRGSLARDAARRQPAGAGCTARLAL
jgi:polar amino acid transport system substrate-binding protein